MFDLLVSKPAECAIRGILILVGIINILPITGVASADRIETLYSVVIDSPELEILMRHRAVLFGLLGGFILVSVFRPNLRLLACIAGTLSMLSFISIAFLVGEIGRQIDFVILMDVIGLIAMVIVAPLIIRSRRLSV